MVGRTLTINGNVDFNNGSWVIVDSGAVLTINGDLNNSNNSNGIIFNGVVNVNGNVVGGNGSAIVSTGGYNGQLNVSGTVTSNGTGSIFGSTADCTVGPCNSSASNPLPVKMLFLNAAQGADNTVKLNWATATEINNSFFTIQRSVNGVTFESIDKVYGAGNSTFTKYYSFTDNSPLKGVSYYRLKQTDYDGKYSYSYLVAVKFFDSHDDKLTVFPNPGQSGSTTHIQFNAAANTEFTLNLYDAFGNKLYSEMRIAGSENSPVLVDLTNSLAAGVYYVTATSGTDVYSNKLIVK